MRELQIVNARPRYGRVPLLEPPPTGYIHLAAAVEPPAGPPIPRSSPRKTALLAEMKALAQQLDGLEHVAKATIYRGVLTPPAGGYAKRHGAHPARFDVAALVETTSVGALDEVRASEPYRRLHGRVAETAKDVHEMAARCVRYIGPVDKTRQGLFLFNHFVAEDAEVALELWDLLADWYRVETGLDNSTLLAPIDHADYVLVNHARWDDSLPRFAFKQFSKRSFRSYVLANMRANRVGAMPNLYRLA